MYTDCESLIFQAPAALPKTSVMEISAAGVDLNKIVVDKPGTSADAGQGVVDPSQLVGCLQQAHAKGWSAGGNLLPLAYRWFHSLMCVHVAVMGWQYPETDTTWITTVRGSVFPL